MDRDLKIFIFELVIFLVSVGQLSMKVLYPYFNTVLFIDMIVIVQFILYFVINFIVKKS